MGLLHEIVSFLSPEVPKQELENHFQGISGRRMHELEESGDFQNLFQVSEVVPRITKFHLGSLCWLQCRKRVTEGIILRIQLKSAFFLKHVYEINVPNRIPGFEKLIRTIFYSLIFYENMWLQFRHHYSQLFDLICFSCSNFLEVTSFCFCYITLQWQTERARLRSRNHSWIIVLLTDIKERPSWKNWKGKDILARCVFCVINAF